MSTVSSRRKKTNMVIKKNIPYLLLSMPAVLWLALFHYVPIFGLVMAFKNYNYTGGIWGSPWCGFDNFEYFFKSNEIFRVFRNTIGYNLAWMLIINIALGAIVAIMLYDVKSKRANKGFQLSLLIPNFVSWVVVAYIGYIILSPTTGIANQVLHTLGFENINWYNEPVYWPFILTFFSIWKDVGMASLYYYSALLCIDPCLFEAAELDGAGKFKQIWYISVPELKPMICMILILKMGSIVGGTMDIFYQVPMNSSALYGTTDTIATYVYRGLVSGSVGTTAAIGLFQSVIGMILLISTNLIIKKINPEQAVF